MNAKINWKYFFIGLLVGLVFVVSWKIILVLGLCGVIFAMFTVSFMDFSGDGDGRQRPSNWDQR
jgi:hypothetical protein